MYKLQGVHCDMLESKCIFWADKLFSQAKIFFLNCLKINIYEYLKKCHERQKFLSEKASYFRCLKIINLILRVWGFHAAMHS